jgi:hypothetical protein
MPSPARARSPTAVAPAKPSLDAHLVKPLDVNAVVRAIERERLTSESV